MPRLVPQQHKVSLLVDLLLQASVLGPYEHLDVPIDGVQDAHSQRREEVALPCLGPHGYWQEVCEDHGSASAFGAPGQVLGPSGVPLQHHRLYCAPEAEGHEADSSRRRLVPQVGAREAEVEALVPEDPAAPPRPIPCAGVLRSQADGPKEALGLSLDLGKAQAVGELDLLLLLLAGGRLARPSVTAILILRIILLFAPLLLQTRLQAGECLGRAGE
mmetsp:Transcript_15008/g.30549  ORF Transcript_15008/g.30549 Transcript_15008/m.30549 type:complete len:217 (+) Transcript_15008:99-749(+)